MTKIIIHEADEPDAVVYLFDTDSLAGQAGTEIDFLAIKAKAAAKKGIGDAMRRRWPERKKKEKDS